MCSFSMVAAVRVINWESVIITGLSTRFSFMRDKDIAFILIYNQKVIKRDVERLFIS